MEDGNLSTPLTETGGKYPRPWSANRDLIFDANQEYVLSVYEADLTYGDDADTLAAFIVERVNAAEVADLGGE